MVSQLSPDIGQRWISEGYTLLREEANETHTLIYQKTVPTIHRIALAILAAAAVATILPYFLFSEQIATYWRQALTGVDQKIEVAPLVPAPPLSRPQSDKNTFFLAEETLERADIMREEPLEGLEGFIEQVQDPNLKQKLLETSKNLMISYTEYGKAILPSIRLQGGDFAAAIYALSKDKNLDMPLWSLLFLRDTIQTYWKREKETIGYKLYEAKFPSLENIKRAVAANGPIIVCLSFITVKEFDVFCNRYGEEFTEEPHRDAVRFGIVTQIKKKIEFCVEKAVIIDAVSEDLSSVRLRIPSDGTEVTVKAEAFLRKRISKSPGWQIVPLIHEHDPADNRYLYPKNQESEFIMPSRGIQYLLPRSIPLELKANFLR